MSQQKMKFRFIAFFLAAVFALSMISLPVWAEEEQAKRAVAEQLTSMFTALQNAQQDSQSSPPLPGDILINGDTEHIALHSVTPGEKFPFTGRLIVKPIQDQIKAIAYGHEALFKSIVLSDVESTFTVTLTLPDGLKFSENSYRFTENEANIFKVTDCQFQGQKVTVTMELKNKDKYTTFDILYNDVTNCPDLDIQIPGVVVDPKIAIGTELTTTGTVVGSFSATASLYGNTQPYNFHWSAVQDPDGKDFKFKDDPNNTEITYTVIVVEPAPEEEQDILIPCPYPCQVPPMWNPQPQPSQVIQQVQPMTQAPVQNVNAAQAPIQLPKTGEKRPQPLSLFFLLSASALFLLRRKMR